MFEYEKPATNYHPQFGEANAFILQLVIEGGLSEPKRVAELEEMAAKNNIAGLAIDQAVKRAITADEGLLQQRFAKGVEESMRIKEYRGLLAWMAGYTIPEEV